MNVAALIETAIVEFGSEIKLAKAADVGQAPINEAKRKGRVGHRMALGIVRATEGVFPSTIYSPTWPRGDAA
jgi:hypothetical protein